MPEIGEIKIGHNYAKYVWHACVDCGRERWATFRVGTGQPRNIRCPSCGCLQKKHGRTIGKGGYIYIYLHPDNFFFSMATGSLTHRGGYVAEHRLVVAKHLGRNLHTWEIVHHKNHVRDDNRIENLQLVTDDRHKQISVLERRITNLEKQVSLLKFQIRGLNKQLRATEV